MKTNKMLLLGLALAVTFALQAQTETPAPTSTPQESMEPQRRARPNGQRGAQMKAQRDELIAKLNLSPEQRGQFDAINQNYREQTRELRENSGTGRRAMGQQMQALRQQQQADIKAILTPEQVTIFDEEIASRRTNRRARRG